MHRSYLESKQDFINYIRMHNVQLRHVDLDSLVGRKVLFKQDGRFGYGIIDHIITSDGSDYIFSIQILERYFLHERETFGHFGESNDASRTDFWNVCKENIAPANHNSQLELF